MGKMSRLASKIPPQRLLGPVSRRTADVASIDQFPARPCSLQDRLADWLTDWQAHWCWQAGRQEDKYPTRPGLFFLFPFSFYFVSIHFYFIKSNFVTGFVHHYPLDPSGLQRISFGDWNTPVALLTHETRWTRSFDASSSCWGLNLTVIFTDSLFGQQNIRREKCHKMSCFVQNPKTITVIWE